MFNEQNEQMDEHALNIENERLETDNWENERIDKAARERFRELRRSGASLEQAIRKAEDQRYSELARWLNEEVEFPGDVWPEWLVFGSPIPPEVIEEYLGKKEKQNWKKEGF